MGFTRVGHDLATKQQQMRLLYRIFKQPRNPKQQQSKQPLLKNEHRTLTDIFSEEDVQVARKMLRITNH